MLRVAECMLAVQEARYSIGYFLWPKLDDVIQGPLKKYKATTMREFMKVHIQALACSASVVHVMHHASPSVPWYAPHCWSAGASCRSAWLHAYAERAMAILPRSRGPCTPRASVPKRRNTRSTSIWRLACLRRQPLRWLLDQQPRNCAFMCYT